MGSSGVGEVSCSGTADHSWLFVHPWSPPGKSTTLPAPLACSLGSTRDAPSCISRGSGWRWTLPAPSPDEPGPCHRLVTPLLVLPVRAVIDLLQLITSLCMSFHSETVCRRSCFTDFARPSLSREK